MKLVQIEHRHGVLVVAVLPTELIDTEQIAEVGEQLLQAVNTARETRALVDLRRVVFMSSLMIGKLVMVSNRCKSRGLQLKICELSPTVEEVFRILNLGRLIDAHATQAEALAAFGVAAPLADGMPQHEPIETLQRRADSGEAAAQYELGRRLAEGRGVPEDFAAALEWYRKAAAQQHPSAQHALGTAYAYGMQVPQDFDEALKWYRLAADQGHDEAQHQLGMSYAHGLAVPQDHAVAAAWFRRAAEAGHCAAQSALGDLYREGLGVTSNLAEARRWYAKAAAQGDTRAATALHSLPS